MISSQEADQLISSHVNPLNFIDTSLYDCSFKTLSEDCYADRPYPPFHRVAMDGIAIKATFHQEVWTLQDFQKAGDEAKTLIDSKYAIEIMTGSVLPHGCDAVIRYEDIDIHNNIVKLKSPLNLTSFTNIHKQGVDCSEGSLLVEKGACLSAPIIAVLASIGKTRFMTTRLPRVAVISTGDELVEPEQVPSCQHIRRSNSHALKFALKSFGCSEVSLYDSKDSSLEMLALFDKVLQSYDLILVTGGVSAGKYDYVPTVLEELGVRKVFHKIRQKPGKPLWFGTSRLGKPVFGLPGNPQSSLICFYRYVSLALAKLFGKPEKSFQLYGKIRQKLSLTPHLTHFLPVHVSCDETGSIYADIIPHQGSGDFISLAKGDGFIEIPENDDLANDKAYPIYLWRNL